MSFFSFKSRGLAINRAARKLAKLLIGIASNADTPPITDENDGWMRLAPYGTTDYWTQQGDAWKKFDQVFGKEQADAMVTAFNAELAKRGAKYKGLPIYNGHPDADPKRWPDERRYGGIMGLEARPDGLYAKAAWNSLGEENKKEGFLVYPSPAWEYDTKGAAATGKIVPDVLRSVGLTNSPRIQDSIPWVNSDDPDAPDTGDASSQEESNNPISPMHKKMLTGLLGLKDDASDDEIAEAHGKHMDVMDAKSKLDAAHNKLLAAHKKVEDAVKGHQDAIDALNGKVTAANAEIERLRKSASGALLDLAVGAGKVSAAERPAIETALNTDFDAGVKQLAAKKPWLNTKSLNLRQPDGSDLSTPAMRTFAYNSRAAELRAANPHLKTEDDVVRAMHSDEKGKAIFAAMETAAT